MNVDDTIEEFITLSDNVFGHPGSSPDEVIYPGSGTNIITRILREG